MPARGGSRRRSGKDSAADSAKDRAAGNPKDRGDRRPAPPSRPRIELITDDEHPGGTMLVMDDVRQSYVDLDDPTYLDFEYVQYFASVLATLPDGPLAVTHVGGGGLTVPRYLQASRPGSSQIVFEPDTELTELVRSRLPLPREHRIRVRPQEGRAGIRSLAEGSADVVVLDAYADGRVPAALTTLEFFVDVSRVLKADGLLLANLVDEPGLRYVGRVLAGLAAVFGELALVSSNDVLKGRRFGNVVLAASSGPLDVAELRRQIARQPFPAGVRDDAQLAPHYRTVRPWTDAESSSSPEPVRDGWRIR
ncbi:MAG TPA: fused MFS/spermidine synthase [Jatrophihabitans sp.]|jgi:spermidine synthase|nr:fused MFS/spermidine synthase [Jatrophihabitans sp.]